MITAAELRGIKAFAQLPQAAIDYLATSVEDIHLAPGEYFAHEGDDRAFFVVIDGRAELTKVVNGEERVIGERRPGMFFGEVPMTLSTPFPASGRAAEPTRIIRLDPQVFYTLASMAPSVPAFVASLARRYLDWLQAVAAEQPEAAARVIAPRSDAATREAVVFLTRNQVPFDRVTIPDEVDAAAYPIIELPNGRRFEGPALREIAKLVGLEIEPSSGRYDVVILGAGPCGLTAAVNAAAEGLRTLVIECLAPGGQAGTSTRIENYTGFPFGISGDDLASRALRQARRLGAEIVVTRTAEALRPEREQIVLDGGETLSAPVVIISTGVAWRRLPVPDIDRFLGNGVFYGAARSDSTVARGADIAIVGAGNSAGQAAIFFSRFARSVTLLVRGESLDASMSRYLIDQIAANEDIRVETRSEVVGVHGERSLQAVDVIDRATGETTTRPYAVLFVMIGADAVTDWLPAQIARDEHHYIPTGGDAAATPQWTSDRRPFGLETSAPGIFAVGDVRSGSVKRVAAAVGEGGMAIAQVHQYLALAR
ncbi:FAD-dependent oxidoreductase [Microbacterium rhizosphaerae]|uniref:FAD-dependent oxidoreductase n=1 Tax=Microbacterium rhizosphaerae TaxID=1678237 RepID=A0ABZ0SRR2_9MICO|nr:FAD-dependent oxidoreductase [Microbacterium rhizosphaerae]WPR90498.1 FAD-dependent oxidoreductase [Microbacterium rhizosphaerae]